MFSVSSFKALQVCKKSLKFDKFLVTGRAAYITTHTDVVWLLKRNKKLKGPCSVLTFFTIMHANRRFNLNVFKHNGFLSKPIQCVEITL